MKIFAREFSQCFQQGITLSNEGHDHFVVSVKIRFAVYDIEAILGDPALMSARSTATG